MTYTPWTDLAKNCKLAIGSLELQQILTKAQMDSARALQAAGLADIVEEKGNNHVKWRVVQMPSGLEFAYAAISDLDTTDAAVWAREFMRTIALGADLDEGLMIGWFANAMERATRSASTADYSALEERIKAFYDDHGAAMTDPRPYPGATSASEDSLTQRIRRAREVIVDGEVIKSNTSTIANPLDIARKLAHDLHDKHFDPHSHWVPSEDLVGLLLQIDNMTSELVRPRTKYYDPLSDTLQNVKPAELELLEHALRDWMGEMAFLSRKTLRDGTPMLGKFEAEELFRRAQAYLSLDPRDPVMTATGRVVKTHDWEARQDATAAAQKGGAHFAVKDTSQLTYLEKALRLWMTDPTSSARRTLLEVAKRYFGDR